MRSTRGGFSLVEMAVVSALLAVALGSLAMVSTRSQEMYLVEALESDLERQAERAASKVLRELRVCAADALLPDPSLGETDELEYLHATGLDAGGQVVWSAPRSLSLVLEEGELDNGVDDNGNGLADEGRLVLTTDLGGPDEREVVLTHWVRALQEGELENGLDDDGDGLVDEPGFVVEQVRDALVVELTLERLTADGRALTRTSRLVVRPRNRVAPEVE